MKLVEERQFPDGTLTSRYRFTHVLYQNGVDAAIKPTRKMQLAAALAQALEAHWGTQGNEVANDLAVLFETAREFARAADYFRIAALGASGLCEPGGGGAGAPRARRHRNAASGPRPTETGTLNTAGPGQCDDCHPGLSGPGGGKGILESGGELCRQLGDTPQLLPVHFGLSAFHLVKGQARTALAIGHEFLGIAERCQDPAIIVGQRLVGIASFYLGEPLAAREHLERASRGYDPAQHRSLTTMYGGEPEMDTQSYLGLTLWVLGYPDQALASHQKALQLASDVSHAHSRAHTLAFAGVQHQFRHESRRVGDIVQELLTLTVGQGLLMWRKSYSRLMRGWVLAGQGDIAEGIDEIQANLAGLRAFGAQLFQPVLSCVAGRGAP